MSSLYAFFLLLCCGATLLLVSSQDIPTGPCAHKPCLNGGTCVASGSTAYRCICPGVFSGNNCQLAPCSNPGAPSNGHFVPAVSTFPNGTTLSLICDRGYDTSGSTSVTCFNTQWNPAIPTCSAITCPDPGLPVNTVRTPGPAQVFTYGITVQYACITGTTLSSGNASRQCTLAGTWSGSAPVCSAISCADPGNPLNGGRSPHGARLSFNATVTFNCNPGYLLVSGDAKRRCIGNDVWSGRPPVCSDFCANAVCPANTDPNNATWTDCCTFAGRSVQCCRPGVQGVLDDRYRNISNPSCLSDLKRPVVFSACINNLVTCLSLTTKPVLNCPNIHGCRGIRGSDAQCKSAFGANGMLCNSNVVQQSGQGFSTAFCLPPSCANDLNGLAQSDFYMTCDILTKLGGLASCPLDRVVISCPGGNGTYDVGNNPTPKTPSSGGIKPGVLAVVIVVCILGVVALVGVLVFIYTRKKATTDTVDFAKLENEDDGDDE